MSGMIGKKSFNAGDLKKLSAMKIGGMQKGVSSALSGLVSRKESAHKIAKMFSNIAMSKNLLESDSGSSDELETPANEEL